MGRFSKNRERDFNKLNLPQPKKRGRQWTLLLVGDRGRVISLKRFKGLAMTSFFLFGLVTVLAAGLYFLYNAKVDENKRLQTALKDSRLRVTSLMGEKEQLMVRLILAESKIKADPAETTDRPVGKVPKASSAKKASASVAPEAKEDKTAVKAAKKTVMKKPAAIAAAAAPVADIAAERRTDTELQAVDIENLKVSRKLENRRLQVIFKLKKIAPDIETVSGRAFVVLKQNTGDQKKWLTMPSVALDAGKPANVRRGQYFSIARFKTMKFERGFSADPNRFRYLTIFVYAEDGKLLLEKEAPITIEDWSEEPT